MTFSTVASTICLALFPTVALVTALPVGAQDFPSDSQVQAAFGAGYDRLGLIEYCAARHYATTRDVADARRSVDALTGGNSVTAAAKAQEAIGRGGTIVGRQIIGLMDPDNPAHPEIVPAGATMSLADNARAQNTTEQALCGQMAAQAAPLP